MMTETSVSPRIVSAKLFEVLRRYRNGPVYFIEPGGNFGDHLIYKGAYKLAAAAGVTPTIVRFNEFETAAFNPGDVVYMHGGGGFVPWWSGAPMKMLKRLSSEFLGTLIIGPTTFSQDRSYIEGALRDCIGRHHFKELLIFTRDECSFDVIKNYLPCEAMIICDHDTALNLERADLVSELPSRGRYRLLAMRHDKERPPDQAYNYWAWLDPIDVASTFEEWLRFHLHASRIITNRTHSTILGTILGIPTVMLPNSYHKNRSVWEYSLRARGVEWRDRIDAGPLNRAIENNPALKRAFTSRKYRKLLKLRLATLGF